MYYNEVKNERIRIVVDGAYIRNEVSFFVRDGRITVNALQLPSDEDFTGFIEPEALAEKLHQEMNVQIEDHGNRSPGGRYNLASCERTEGDFLSFRFSFYPV